MSTSTPTGIHPHLVIVVAFPAEARALISHYRLKRLHQEKRFEMYTDHNQMSLIISGPGVIQASIATTYAAGVIGNPTHAFFCNIGICGGDAPLGSVFRIHAIDYHGHNDYPFQHGGMRLPGRALQTLDAPSDCYPENTLLDMEGAGFYQAARQLVTHEQVALMKVISDNPTTPYQQLTKPKITQYLSDALPQIHSFCDRLIALSAEEVRALPEPHPLLDDILSRWHFSQYQRHQLESHLQAWQMHYSESALTKLLSSCHNSRSVIQTLSQQLSELKPDWSTPCK